MGRGSTPSGSEAPSWLPSPPSRTWGEEVLRLDRRLHLGFPLHLPGDVDLQAGVRRGRTRNRPPQMLLSPPKMLLDYVYSVFVADQADSSCFMNIDSFSSFFFFDNFINFLNFINSINFSFEFFIMK